MGRQFPDCARESKQRFWWTPRSMAADNPMIANLAGLGGIAGPMSSLETEVKILESPSVLKPIYDFVKASKAAAGGVDVSEWVYTDWVDNLSNRVD